jgi:alanine racemase
VSLRALARVNLAAIERNVATLRAHILPGVRFCAVVKANASGHGAVPVARAALAAGADILAVATALEAAELRAAGLTVPVLIMGAVSAEELPVALEARAELVAWTEDFVDALGRMPGAPVDVHIKLDTGMGRLGTRRMAEALNVAERVLAAPDLRLAGAMTHLATADEDSEFVRAQLASFDPFVTEMRRRQPLLVAHAANSAATVGEPDSHYDMVRCGIALHGCDPMNDAPEHYGLEPALELSSYVAAVKPAAAGESVGYGRRFVAERDTWIATLPIGYGDGIRRSLTNNADVLIAGQRFPLVGTISMDNLTADVGPSLPPDVVPGTPAVLIGRDGAERQTVEDLARRMDSIPHEVLCGISSRVVRRYHRDEQAVKPGRSG